MRTVVGLFDSFDDAQGAVDELKQNGFDRSQIQIENEAKGESSFRTTETTNYSVHGLSSHLISAGLPKGDAESYVEGVRRGGTLVIVSAEDDMATKAYDILGRHETVDLDERMGTWKTTGWAGASEVGLKEKTTAVRSEAAVQLKEGQKVLPVIEEEMMVGKREVGKGGLRAYSRTTEVPVEEQIHLREETVHVERRPVDRAVTDADLARMRDTTVEVRATSEEAVISKQARVVEEVVIGKDVQDRTQTVRDTVRRTDVEVEKLEGVEMKSDVQFETYDKDFRTHYQGLRLTDSNYDEFLPVYRYGYTLGTNPKYRTGEWTTIEPEVRKSWEERNPGTWERFKDSVRYAWDKVRGAR